MKIRNFVFFFLCLLSASACHHAAKELSTLQGPRKVVSYGAVYIACENPAWRFDFEGLLSCVQDMHADTTTLNPEFTCPMSSIQKFVGEIELNFSEQLNLGRLFIKTVGDSVEIRDINNQVLEELYFNDDDRFYLIRNSQQLRVNVRNVYIGGCYHELLRWEEVE
jgi:hypothetical protein